MPPLTRWRGQRPPHGAMVNLVLDIQESKDTVYQAAAERICTWRL
ncbi:hypothetical protein ACFFTQ_37810 [Streptomyces roseofulvus]